MRARLAPLRVPALRRLLTAYGAGILGEWLAELALTILVLRRTGSAAAVTALWLATTLAPAAAVSAVVARLPVRLDRALLAARAGQALILSMLAVAAAAQAPLAVLFVLAALDALLRSAGASVLKAAVVRVARPAGMHAEANALLGSLFTVAFAAGPAVAGACLLAAGPVGALACRAVVAVAGAASVRRLGAIGSSERASGRRRSGALVLAQRLLAMPPARALLLADVAFSVVFTVTVPVEALFVARTLGGGAGAYSAALTAWGIGALFGALPAVDRARALRGTPLACLALAGAYLGLAVAGSVPEAVALCALGGLGNGFAACTLLTLLQERVADGEQTCLGALLETLHGAGPALGYLLGGAIASAADPRWAYALAGIAALGVAAALARPRAAQLDAALLVRA